MKKTIKKICAGVIVCVLAFGCTACATLAERQKAEEIIHRAEEEIQKAEEEKEKRQEQYRNLGDSISDVTPPALPDYTYLAAGSSYSRGGCPSL